MQKLIKTIIEMADSNNINKKSGENEVVVKNAQTNAEEQPTAIVKNIDPREDDMNLSFMDKDFIYECMSVPTYSEMEYRMVTFIILWARRNNIKYEFDDFGNIYLTKGKLDSGEFYPCVTSHLDTVQDKQEPYIYASVPLDIKTEVTEKKLHKISVDSYGGTPIGIGADDKSGICICLSLFKHFDKLKACFFLDEERGCNGSNALDKEWFNDVGYVIGYDSPDLYRAAWSCNGIKLFSYDFYTKYMKDVCDKWGLTKGCFFSEPYTDVKVIREKTNIICMNFGNGGYWAHSSSEYCIIEDMDHACGMGVDLIKSIGCTEHKLECTSQYSYNKYTYKRNSDGTYKCVTNDDTELLKDLGDNVRKVTYGYTSYSSGNSSSSTSKTVTKKEDELKFETVKYIVDRYESHILGIKDDVSQSIKDICETLGIDFAPFEKSINENFSNEIKF